MNRRRDNIRPLLSAARQLLESRALLAGLAIVAGMAVVAVLASALLYPGAGRAAHTLSPPGGPEFARNAVPILSDNAVGMSTSDASAADSRGGLPSVTTVPYWLAKQRQARMTTPTAPDLPADEASPDSASPLSVTPTTVSTTNLVLSAGQTPLAGVWSGTASMLADYLLRDNPRPSFTVPTSTLAELYVTYAAEVGLRADVLWAQMIHETGFGRYGGDVAPAQNNYAGIGATGGGEPGCSFASAEAGVQAHIAHMVAYVWTVSPAAWANAQTDPRFDAVPNRGSARVLSDLDGRWAVPGVGYGARIERHVDAINRMRP